MYFHHSKTRRLTCIYLCACVTSF